MQTFTFYASEDKLTNRGHTAGNIGYEAINQAACDLAKEVASKGDALVAGNISQVPAYLKGLGKEAVQKEFKKQTDIFVKNDVDFLIGEVNTPYCRCYISGVIQQPLFFVRVRGLRGVGGIEWGRNRNRILCFRFCRCFDNLPFYYVLFQLKTSMPSINQSKSTTNVLFDTLAIN